MSVRFNYVEICTPFTKTVAGILHEMEAGLYFKTTVKFC